MNLLQQGLILQISALKGNLLRLRFPGLPFSVPILSNCFDLLILPTSFLALLAFLIITFTFPSVVWAQKIAANSFVSVDKYQHRLKLTQQQNLANQFHVSNFFSDKLQRKQSTLKITSS